MKNLITAKKFTQNTAEKVAAKILETPNEYVALTDFPCKRHSLRYDRVVNTLEQTSGVLSVLVRYSASGISVAAFTKDV
jgi:hypothetical protein